MSCCGSGLCKGVPIILSPPVNNVINTVMVSTERHWLEYALNHCLKVFSV